MVFKKEKLTQALLVMDVKNQLLDSVTNAFNVPTMIYVNVVKQNESTLDIT